MTGLKSKKSFRKNRGIFSKLSMGFAMAGLLLSTSAKKVEALEVAIFNNGSYVDVNTDFEGESYNLQFAVEGLGHNIQLFVGTDLAGFQNALASKSVLVIPELEIGSLVDDLDTDTRDFIRDFISSGNRLIVIGDDDARYAALLNSILSLDTLTSSFIDAGNILNLQSGTDQTVYEGLSSSILSLDGTYLISGLPVEAKVIYGLSQDEGVVVELPYGNGKAIFLGYDWYDSYAAPDCGDCQDEGWSDVLERVLAQAEINVSFETAPQSNLKVGEQFDITLKVENAGLSPAYQNELTLQIPSAVSVVDMPTECDGTSTIVCQFDPIAVDNFNTFDFTLSALSAGNYQLAASVSSETFEQDLSDNTASIALINEADSGGCSLNATASSTFSWLAAAFIPVMIWLRRKLLS